MSRPVKITSTSKPTWRCDQWGSQMSVKRIVPDIKSKHLDASRQFYVEVLGLEVAMDMGFIVTLVSPSNPTAQVSLMRDYDSSSILPQIIIVTPSEAKWQKRRHPQDTRLKNLQKTSVECSAPLGRRPKAGSVSGRQSSSSSRSYVMRRRTS